MAASANAWTVASAWAAMMVRRRFHRSARTPANGATTNVRIWEANPATPSSTFDPVRSYTSQPIATLCIHVPVTESPCPKKYRRKLRCRRDRMIDVMERVRVRG